MKIIGLLFALVILSTSVSAAIIMSGDAGEGWARELAAEKCLGEDVGAVYICLGNVVRVVSTVPGAGSTFYEPDGNVAQCPLVSPSEMGAECVQMTMPNYCPEEVVCGEPEEHVFPGHSDYEEEMEEPDVQPEVPVEEPEEEPEVVPVEEEPEETTTPPQPVRRTADDTESIFDSLSLLVLGLGIVAIAVVYLLFRRTAGHR